MRGVQRPPFFVLFRSRMLTPLTSGHCCSSVLCRQRLLEKLQNRLGNQGAASNDSPSPPNSGNSSQSASQRPYQVTIDIPAAPPSASAVMTSRLSVPFPRVLPASWLCTMDFPCLSRAVMSAPLFFAHMTVCDRIHICVLRIRLCQHVKFLVVQGLGFRV